MMDIGDQINYMEKNPEKLWQPWRRKPDALPLSAFPSKEFLGKMRDRIPESLYLIEYTTPEFTEQYSYKVREAIPTPDDLEKLQEGFHSITDPEFSLSDLFEATLTMKVDQRYGTSYGISPEGEEATLTPGSESDFYNRIDDLQSVMQELPKELLKIFSRKEMFRPFSRLNGKG